MVVVLFFNRSGFIVSENDSNSLRDILLLVQSRNMVEDPFVVSIEKGMS